MRRGTPDLSKAGYEALALKLVRSHVLAYNERQKRLALEALMEEFVPAASAGEGVRRMARLVTSVANVARCAINELGYRVSHFDDASLLKELDNLKETYGIGEGAA